MVDMIVFKNFKILIDHGCIALGLSSMLLHISPNLFLVEVETSLNF